MKSRPCKIFWQFLICMGNIDIGNSYLGHSAYKKSVVSYYNKPQKHCSYAVMFDTSMKKGG